MVEKMLDTFNVLFMTKMYFSFGVAFINGKLVFLSIFSTKMYVQKPYFNIFQELVFLNATNQRIYIWTEGSSFLKMQCKL